VTNGDLQQNRLDQAGADILRIGRTSVLVVVDEVDLTLPQYHPAWPLCRALGALGFGNIHLLGAGPLGEEFALMMEGFPFEYGEEVWGETPTCDIVLHLGTQPELQQHSARLAQAGASAFTSVRWEASRVVMESLEGILQRDRASLRSTAVAEVPLEPIARMGAGLVLQQALIFAGRLEDATPPDDLVAFDAAAEMRAPQADTPRWPDLFIEDAVIEEVGAGAVGTHLLESFAPMLGSGCEIRIFDFDLVAPENLATQPVFRHEDIGRPKAVVIAEKLAYLCAGELRIACPDSFAAREAINRSSLDDGIPLVEAGSAPLVAQQRSYLPGRTACLAHRIPNFAQRAREERNPQRCSLEPALTLPGTSMICGGMLAAEALRALRPEVYGWPSAGTVVYDAHFPARFGVIDPRPPCAHP
jgi:molybdopterin/thiamine biosynthesis adenylyltransferase